MKPDSSTMHFKRSMLFIALLALCVMASNMLYYYFCLRNTDLDIADRQFEETIHDTKTYIMGDSILEMDLDPRRIKDSFCYASRGENYYETYYKLRKILRSGAKPKTIILPLYFDSFSMDKINHPMKDVWYWKRFISYMAVARETGNYDFLKARIENSIEFLGAAGNYTRHHEAEDDSSIFKGFRLDIPHQILSQEKASVKKESSLHYLKYFKNSLVTQPFLLKYFELILSLSQERGIDVVLIKPPLSKTFLSLLKNNFDQDKFYTPINEIIQKYHNAHVLNYQNLIEDEALFYDPIHLNIDGAKAMSERFNSDLKNY